MKHDGSARRTTQGLGTGSSNAGIARQGEVNEESRYSFRAGKRAEKVKTDDDYCFFEGPLTNLVGCRGDTGG